MLVRDGRRALKAPATECATSFPRPRSRPHSPSLPVQQLPLLSVTLLPFLLFFAFSPPPPCPLPPPQPSGNACCLCSRPSAPEPPRRMYRRRYTAWSRSMLRYAPLHWPHCPVSRYWERACRHQVREEQGGEGLSGTGVTVQPGLSRSRFFTQLVGAVLLVEMYTIHTNHLHIYRCGPAGRAVHLPP